MFRYGLLFGVVGTITCVTLESERQLPYKPVCGTDEETQTHMDKQSNYQNIEGTEYSDLVTSYENCFNQDRFRRSTNVCSTEVREVCGTDGVTYSNPCMLNQAHTLEHNVTLSHFGPCANKTIEETKETNNIEDAVNEVSSNQAVQEDLVQNLKISDTDGVHVENNLEDDKNEGYDENEEVNEAQNLKVIIEKQATGNENVSIVSSDKTRNAENNLDTNNEKQTENESHGKEFVDVIQNASNFHDAQLNMIIKGEKSINNAQNTTDAVDVNQSTSEAQNENKLGKSQKLNQEQTQTSEEFEGYAKNGKNKSRNRRSIQNLADSNVNKKQNQSELEQDKNKNKSKKTYTHHTGANLIDSNAKTASETEVNGRFKDNRINPEKSRKLRDAQNNAHSNGNNVLEMFETKGPEVVLNKKSKVVDEVQGKSKNNKTKLEKSRKIRDVQKDNIQSKNGDGISESEHVRVSRKMESKINKNTKQNLKSRQDKVTLSKVRKTRELKERSLSKKGWKPARSEDRATSNHKRGKHGGGKKKNGRNNVSKGASLS